MDKTIIIGIDPGSGTRSNTGLAVIDPINIEILYIDELSPASKYDPTDVRLYDLAVQYEVTLNTILDGIGKDEALVVFEQFVMKGKGGETLSRLIGAFLGRTNYPTYHVNNMVVKQKITGFGGSDDKKAVGRGLESYFRGSKSSLSIIKDLIDKESWDMIDAIAIAVAGSEQYKEEARSGKKAETRRSRSRTRTVRST